MRRKPGWLPDIDPDQVSQAIEVNLEDLPGVPIQEVLSAAQGPTALVFGTVLGSLAGRKAVETGQKLDLRIDKFVEENPSENAYLTKIASGFSLLLPDGDVLRDAALGARDDPEKLREYLRKYHQDESKREEIDEAIHRLLSGDLDNFESKLKDCFGTSNVEAAQAMLLDFRDIIQAQQVQLVLQKTLEIEDQFEDIGTVLEETRTQLLDKLEKQDWIQLRNEGFVRLTPTYFDREPTDFESALLSGFSLVDVRAGYSIPRNRDGDSSSTSENLFDLLAKGEDRLLIGPGGAGKSTVCKTVACTWYDRPETGPVFYRESGRAAAFESVGTLLNAIQESEGHVLVVAEDAVRHEVQSIFEVVEECRHLPDVEVSFLFDARRDEIQNSNLPHDLETGVQDRVKSTAAAIERYQLPAVDVSTCNRLIQQFENQTGRSVNRSASTMLAELDPEIDAGQMIYLTYFLPIRGSAEEVGLHGDVANKFKIIHEPASRNERYARFNEYDQDLLEDVALTINLLNATHLGVFPELIHCLVHVHGDDVRTHDDIEDICSSLTGWMIHERSSETALVPYTTHEIWSTLYLKELVEQTEETGTRRRRRSRAHRKFARCVNSILALFENEELYESLRREFGDSIGLEPVEKAPEETAYVSAAAIFGLGTRWPVLTGLFESTDRSEIELPHSPSSARSYCINERGRMFLARRDPDQERDDIRLAEEEFQQALALSEEAESPHEKLKGETTALGNLGNVALVRHELDEAEEYHRRSLEKEKQLGRNWGIAAGYGSLGNVYHAKHEWDKAKEYHEKALEIERSINEVFGVVETLNNLGSVELSRSRYDEAEDYLNESLEIAERMGFYRLQIGALGNLSKVALDRGEHDLAEELIDESLEISREIGDTEGVIFGLISKGNMFAQSSNQDQAEDDLQEALRLARELDDNRARAKANGLLGIIARERGDLNQAVEFAEKGVNLAREINDVSTEADCLRDMGHAIGLQREFEEGLGYLAEAISIYDDLGDKHSKASCLTTYGWLMMSAGELEKAEKYLEPAMAMAHDVGDRDTRARCMSNLALAAVGKREVERARKFYEPACREFLDMGMMHHASRSVEMLIPVLEELGDDEALKRWRKRVDEYGLEVDPPEHLPDRRPFVWTDSEGNDRTDEMLQMMQDPDFKYIPFGPGAGLLTIDRDEEGE